MPYRIALLGPPGAGKGTQAERLAPVLRVPIIGPGALYRREISEGTGFGKRIAGVVGHGDMVPNDITREVMARRLAEPNCTGGFILDGYPRDFDQAHDLDAIAPPLTHAVLLTAAEATVIDRLSHRLICICGKAYDGREITIDSGHEATCAACDGTLERRKDDDPESIQRRITLYHEITEPVIEEYRRRGILIEVDGERSIEVVHQDVLAQLGIFV